MQQPAEKSPLPASTCVCVLPLYVSHLCSLAEIPLFHVVAAKVTFGNLNGDDTPVPHVQVAAMEHDSQMDTPSSSQAAGEFRMVAVGQEGLKRRHGGACDRAGAQPTSAGIREVAVGEVGSDVKRKCVISDACFEVPEGYRKLSRGRAQPYDDDELLQLAIEQSLLEQGPTVEEFLYESAQVGDSPVQWVHIDVLLCSNQC